MSNKNTNDVLTSEDIEQGGISSGALTAIIIAVGVVLILISTYYMFSWGGWSLPRVSNFAYRPDTQPFRRPATSLMQV